jgi:hypothetical protein
MTRTVSDEQVTRDIRQSTTQTTPPQAVKAFQPPPQNGIGIGHVPLELAVPTRRWHRDLGEFAAKSMANQLSNLPRRRTVFELLELAFEPSEVDVVSIVCKERCEITEPDKTRAPMLEQVLQHEGEVEFGRR